jgi:hypothetical protein
LWTEEQQVKDMDPARKDPQPDETDSAAVGNGLDDQPRADAESIKTDAGEATASHKPSDADEVATESERVDEEYILEREPDGRYRIVGRRPRQKEPEQ